MQYQYLGTYENYQLRCPNCSAVFLARGVHSTAPSNGAGGFGWRFDPHRQDFGFNNQPVSATFNGAGNAFINGGGFNLFPNEASRAAFFSSAAASAAAQSKMAAAAAAAASSAVPSNNLAPDFVQKFFDNLNRVEAEREVERKEEFRKEEKDAQRKARDAERSREAMGRSMAKQKEQDMARDAGKGQVDARAAGRKHKRKKQDSEHEAEENLENNDPKVYEQRMSMQDDQSSLGRRSSGSKKNVTTYKVDFSDDLDMDDFPGAKRGKFEGGAEDGAEDGVKSEDDEEEVCRKQCDNSMKGKSVPGNSHFMKRGVGAKTGEEMAGSRHVKEKNRCDQGKAANKDPHNSNFVEIPIRSDPTARESKLDGGPGVTHRLNGGKSLQQVESPSAGLKTHRLSYRDFENQNLPSKSRSTLRTRIRSLQVPLGSKSAFFGEYHMGQQPVPSPTKSLASLPSEPDAEEDSEGFEKDSDVQGNVVPNPEFHDFDCFRTEMDVRPGQIWAIYDNQDGMPRLYGRISRVSSKPFRAHMNWLELSALTDSEIAWTTSTGLVRACGEFQIGRITFMDQIKTFSHIVMKKSGKGMLINIYPKKGQVWAIYRDWDAEQRIGSARVIRSNGGSPYTYDMVEILSEFSDGYSLQAAVLFKIHGFKTVFSRHKDMEEFRYFKTTELVKFSHNVPYQRIDDVEAERCGIPQGALELDPESTPLDLIISPSDPSE